MSEVDFDQLLGSDAGNTDLGDWELAEGNADGAELLGASQVPRGPVLDDANFSQMVANAFIHNREPMRVQMPWEKGVGKLLFNKKSLAIPSAPFKSRKWER